MSHNIINPFKMTQDQLVEYAMNPNSYSFEKSGTLNKYPVLGTSYKVYDPYQSIVEEHLEANEGDKPLPFLAEQNYDKPVFQEQDPDAVLISLNVKAQADEFRREDETMNAINALYNPVSGNTPEERAKSATINKLLAEIDNFASQYKISQSQKETLKTQVLSQHLGEYIQTKNALQKQQKDTQRAGAMAIANGESEQVGKVVRDPVNGLDEYGIRTGAGETKDGDTIGNMEMEEVSDVLPGSASASGGDIGSATTRGSGVDVREQARLLADAIQRLGPSNRGTVTSFIKTRPRKSSWNRAFKLFGETTRSTADQRFYDEQELNVIMPVLANILNFGERVSEEEKDNLINILWEAKKFL